ncbi:MAG TPA: hypothetical protein VLF91_03530 [Candidatus Saccharimonadales bacterium]|nr:hypothetical protein [Candidatus Saccharimonadales bacterium]
MLFKPNALVYVLSSALIVGGKHLPQARLDFPPELFCNLEITNRPKFASLCQQFFTDHGFVHRRVLIVLDSSVVFKRRIELDETGQPDTLTDAFVDAMPFAAGQRACVALQSAEELELYATNADIYRTLAEGLEASNVRKLVAVLPVGVFKLHGKNQRLSSLITHFLQEGADSDRVNFLSAEPV